MQRNLAHLALAVLLAGCDPPKTPLPPDDSVTPSVRVQIADYAAIEKLIAGHRGKVVVVDIWATNCPPCLEEFHHLVELHKKYGPERIACVSLSLDYEGIVDKPPESYTPKVLKFLNEQGATFDNIIASEESEVMMNQHLRITNPPAVFVYDKTGRRREKIMPDVEAESDRPAPKIYDRVGQLVAELMK